jgi:hypothetical protein
MAGSGCGCQRGLSRVFERNSFLRRRGRAPYIEGSWVAPAWGRPPNSAEDLRFSISAAGD